MEAVVKASPAPGFVVADVAPAEPGPGEVLLRVEAASVCGTDVHLFDWNPWAASRVRPPRVMGHEMCGEVVAAGEGVDPPSGRVAVESHLVCGSCDECHRGDFHVCSNTRILGVDVDGVFCSHVVVPARNLWPVGDLPPEQAALMEPFGNAVHACSVGALRGRTVLVTGCGPIGCATVAIARAEGAARVVATDVRRYRLDLAERMGAHALVQAPADDVKLREAAAGAIDCVLEMSGSPDAIAQATRLVRPGGWVSLLGIGDGSAVLDLSRDVVMKGVSLHGIVGRRLYDTWEQTTAYLRSGRIDAAALLTHTFALAEVHQAIDLIKSGRCGKVVLRPGQSS